MRRLMATTWLNFAGRHCILLFIVNFILSCKANLIPEAKQVYIIHLDNAHSLGSTLDIELAGLRHSKLLSLVHNSVTAAFDSHIYSYKHVFDGFSAVLTHDQAATLSEMTEVLSIFPSTMNELQTTHSWEFLGFDPEENQIDILGGGNYSTDVIVGVLDSGIWPESHSFKDDSFTPIPSRWKGKCVHSDSFDPAIHCNRKLIGARYYIKGYLATNSSLEGSTLSPRDWIGHGTHISSIIAGRVIDNINLFELMNGSAKGGAPGARIAMYKVCWPKGCNSADTLAAFDDAIHDGVDILSISLGNPPPQREYTKDANAIGTFRAMQKGILTTLSAGNKGPEGGSVVNSAPWVLTVGASTMDRRFSTDLSLGNNITYKVYSGSISLPDATPWLQLILGRKAANSPSNVYNASECMEGSLDVGIVKDKIVLCELDQQRQRYSGELRDLAIYIANSGGLGVIVVDERLMQEPNYVKVPCALVDLAIGKAIKEYILSRSVTLGRIGAPYLEMGNTIKAPIMADFSGRGPNPRTPDILKPDITAPGVGIVASWIPLSQFSGLNYNIVSGTSMSTPHVAGVAAMIKALHPTWSPSAIKSAIMTTATQMDNQGEFIKDAGTTMSLAGPFTYGGGQINPTQAAHPGLIFDATSEDYTLFLCSSGYTQTNVSIFTGTKYNCVKSPPIIDFNYPSVHFHNLVHNGSSITTTRTVTNVGDATSTYHAKIRSPFGVSIEVQPRTLRFSHLEEKSSFSITLKQKQENKEFRLGGWASGAITWMDTKKKFIVNIVVVASWRGYKI